MRLRNWNVARLFLLLLGISNAIEPYRILTFRKGSTFFYRMNYKITSLSYTKIFAQATGFKVAWELPTIDNVGVRIGRSVKDVHESAEIIYESHGFDGRSCLLKNICQALEYVKHKDGVITKILKLLIGSYIANNGSLFENPPFCPVHIESCPLQFVGIDSFSGQLEQ